MKKLSYVMLLVLIGITYLSSPAVYSCTAIYLNREKKISARNIDINIEKTILSVSPRGSEHNAVINNSKQTPLKWKSKYGNIIFTLVMPKKGFNSPVEKNSVLGSVDGINEHGLKIGAYYNFSAYPQTNNDLPVLDAGSWVQYFLDNFKSVDEAVKFIESQTIYIVIEQQNDDLLMQLHYYLHDKTGDSAIVEYINGKVVIYNNPKVNALANTPYAEEVKKLKEYKTFGGNKIIPGGFSSLQRFVRAAYYLKRIPKEIGPNYTLIDAAIEVIQSCNQPPIQSYYGLPGWGNKPLPSVTLYTVITDISDMKIYYRTLSGPNFVTIDFNKFDFSKGQKIKYLPVPGGKLTE